MAGQYTSVTAVDYNTIQDIVAKILGAPTDSLPQYGYNQTLTSSQVTGGTVGTVNKVTVAQWSNLARDLVYARIHQNGNLNEATQLPAPNDSNIISESFRLSYYNYAQTIQTNAATAAANQLTTNTIATAQRINAWAGNITSTVTLDFASVAGARAHWNTGGSISVACNLSGSFGVKSATKDNTWKGMFGAMGTISINRNTTTITGSSTGGYTCTPTNKGFFDLTTSATLLFTCTPPSGAYAANSFKIFGSVDGTGRYVYLTIQYNDDAGVTSGTSVQWGGDEVVDGILGQYIGCTRASGSFVSLNPPGVSFSGDLTNMQSAPGLYGLQSDKYNINEGDSFTIKLQTLNVNSGAILYYTVSGLANTPNGVARYSASSNYFTVGSDGTATVDFTIVNDLYSDGVSTMTIALNNNLASIGINVNDTSITPKDYTFLSSTQFFTVPSGIYKLYIAMVGGGGGGGAFCGGGGGGGAVITTTVDVSPGQQISFTSGSGGGAGGGGGTSYFGAFTALGGSAGTNGSLAGTTYTGGNGGQSGSGKPGGLGSSTPKSSIIKFGGGGGGGSSGNGVSASSVNLTVGSGGTGTTVGSSNNAYSRATNQTYFIGGGGEGGASFPESTSGSSYGGGPGGGTDQNGFGGTDGTGGGGGGGGVSVAGGTYTGVYVDATVSSKTGGPGGRGGIFIGWPGV